MCLIKGSQTLAFIFLIVSCLGGAFSSACAQDVFGNPFGDASGEDEDIKISIRLSSETIDPDDIFGVVLDFDLAKGFHLYKDNLEFNWSKLTGVEKAGVIYPTAKLFQNPDGPGTVDAFEDKFTVIHLFRVTAEKGGPMEIRGRVDYQACSDICLFGGKDIYCARKAGSRGEAAVWEAPPETFSPEGEGVEMIEPGRTSWAWADIIIAFVAGVGLSLTPCVLPMVPVTSGIIRGYARPGRLSAFISSLIYALGISLVYGIVGAAVAFVGVQVQSFLSSPFVRIPIAGLLVVLALGMFGVFRIQVPASIQAKAQALGGRTRKSRFGLFLLGMAGGLVVGPCVAPAISGLLLRVGTSGNVVLGFLTMFACGSGICVLLVLSGTFTGLLPRRGEWMVLVERIFGFVLLWAALYFVSHFMPQGVYFFAIGAVFAVATAFFGASRLGLAAKTVVVILLLAGTTVFAGLGGYFMGNPQEHVFREGGRAEVEEALASGRPVIIDFSAPSCVACGELDAYTFSDERVRDELKRFRAVKINIIDHGAFASEYGVKGIPDVRIFDSEGKERKDLNFTGFKDADNVLARLKRVK
jgi:thiol:disulfide interchange protein DsbD